MQNLQLRPLAALSVLCLAACGGGGSSPGVGGATAPSKFASTDSVIAVASATSSGIGALGGVGASTGTSTTAKSARMSTAGFSKASSSGVPAKAATTSNCATSGSRTVTDYPNTAYTDDGVAVFSVCTSTSSSQGSSESTIVDGKVDDLCTDGAQTSSVCNAERVALGDSSKAFSINYKQSGSTTEDVLLQFTGGADASTSGATDSATLSLTLRYTDNIAKQYVEVLFDNFKDVYTSGQSTSTETVNGGLGVSGSISRCAVGKVTVKTNSPITYNSSGATTAGNLTVTDGSGQAATVQYNSDGSATVTLGGSTKTYTASQIDSFCDS